MSSFLAEVLCTQCGRRSDPSTVWLTCAECGEEAGIQEIRFDLDAVRQAWQQSPLESRAFNHWRYRELLPLDNDQVPAQWAVGGTPLIDAPRLAAELGVTSLVFKDESRNPTGSFKDRASSVGVAHALEHQANTVACASTGNAATSLAGHAALAGLAAVIFVPATAPAAKLAQLLVYGATVVSVQGSYDEAYRLCSEACRVAGWYNRNCAINPVLVEGKKTAGLELAEQSALLGGVPDWVAVSVGDGCTIAGIWKGFQEMQELGQIDRLPRLLGVQAQGVAPIAAALTEGSLPSGPAESTIADSINVAVPRNWRKAVAAIQAADGRVECVDDAQILHAMRVAGRHGQFAEPAAAAALAGVIQAVDAGTIRGTDRVLVMVTGSGLKDTESALRAGGEPLRIPPDRDALFEALAAQGKPHGC